MRNPCKTLVVTAVLLAAGVFSSSSIRANTLLAGSFTLDHATQWKGTVLPPGSYTFKLARTQNDTNVLEVKGNKKALDILVFAQYACATCQNGELNVAVNGDNRVVTALELPGFHMNFQPSRLSAAEERQLAKSPAPASEKVAVNVNPN